MKTKFCIVNYTVISGSIEFSKWQILLHYNLNYNQGIVKTVLFSCVCVWSLLNLLHNLSREKLLEVELFRYSKRYSFNGSGYYLDYGFYFTSAKKYNMLTLLQSSLRTWLLARLRVDPQPVLSANPHAYCIDYLPTHHSWKLVTLSSMSLPKIIGCFKTKRKLKYLNSMVGVNEPYWRYQRTWTSHQGFSDFNHHKKRIVGGMFFFLSSS